MKRNKGITLIALVITIIILLILAGVTIGLAMNGNGLFDKAKIATDEYNNSVEKENVELEKYEKQIDSFRNSDKKGIDDLELVADLTTGHINRAATLTASFPCEANQEYYVIGYYLANGSGSTNVDTTISIITINEKINFTNATIIKDYNELNMIKIKSDAAGTVNLTMNTGTTNDIYKSRLLLKVFK